MPYQHSVTSLAHERDVFLHDVEASTLLSCTGLAIEASDAAYDMQNRDYASYIVYNGINRIGRFRIGSREGFDGMVPSLISKHCWNSMVILRCY